MYIYLILRLKSTIKNSKSKFLNICSVLYFIFGRNVFRGVKSNNVKWSGNFLKKCKIRFYGHNNTVEFEKNGVNRIINTTFQIYGNNNIITIGSHNTIIRGDFHIEDNDGRINIGNHNAICGYTHLAVIEGKSITIGNYCLFSSNVIFRVGDSHSIISKSSKKRINRSEDIVINDHVWFGNNTTILKGVTILQDSVVATGCIVIDSPKTPNIILAGVPAKIVKREISWDNSRNIECEL